MTAGPFTVRLASRVDADVIARHRVRMFADMGELPSELCEPLRVSAARHLDRTIADGEYIGWLASPADAPDAIVAGAGVLRRWTLPYPRSYPSGTVLTQGNVASVLNVYTEPEWRRRGLGRLLMSHVIAWAREVKLDTLVLHASSDGRRLYESLGFLPTNEMRFAEDLRGPTP